MNTKQHLATIVILMVSLLAPGCGSGLLSPTVTSSPTLSPSVTSISTSTATLTPVPCVQGIPEHIDGIELYFADCKQSDADRTLIREYITRAMAFAPEDAKVAAKVYVVVDTDKLGGRTISKDVSELWSSPDWWRHMSAAEKKEFVLHEMFHLVQFTLSNNAGVPGSNAVPSWYIEGAAQKFAKLELVELGIKPVDHLQVLRSCKTPLTSITSYDHLTNSQMDCMYEEGEVAINLLLQYGSEDQYYDLWRNLPNMGFSKAFEKAYGMPLQQFYDLFETYQKSGYTVMPPVSETPTATP